MSLAGAAIAAAPPLPLVKLRFGANAAEPSTRGRVVVEAVPLAGTVMPDTLTAYYEVDAANSTALVGNDFQTLSGSVTLERDLNWASVIEVVPVDDTLPEGDERLVLRLLPDPNYVVHPWWPTSTVIIVDNDLAGLPPRDFYVATNGNNASPGTLTQPFLTLPYAMTQARYGDTIWMRGGDFREPLNLNGTGMGLFSQTLPLLETSVGSWDKMLTIRNYNNEEVFIKGSDVVTGWQPAVSPDPQMALWQKPWTVLSQQVFVDGRLLGHVGWNAPLNVYPSGDPAYNATQLATVTNAAGVSVLQQNTAHMTNWSFYHNTSAGVLYVALPVGLDPNLRLVEVSTKLPFMVLYDYLKLQGLKFRHSKVFPDTGGWPTVALGNSGILQDCDIQWGDFLGLNVANNCRVINCLIANNGMIGLNAVGTNVLISGCRLLTNHHLPFELRGEAAGAKIIGSPSYLDGSVYEGNEFAWNNGEGLWVDLMSVRHATNEALARPVIVRNNFSHDNTANGFMIEHTGGTRIHNNISVRNRKRALYLSSAIYCRVFNNTLLAPLGSYNCLDIGWRGIPVTDVPHHIWITNNILSTVETNLQLVLSEYYNGTEPQLVNLQVYGTCAGATDIFYDYNCWLVFGERLAQDYFHVANLDTGASGTDCSRGPSSCVQWYGTGSPGWQLCSEGVGPAASSFRLDWAGWQAFGHDPHGAAYFNPAVLNSTFVNPAADDYRIRADGPLAHAGKNLYAYFQEDYAYRPRPVVDNFSVGALEFIDTLRVVATDAAAAEAGLDPGLFTVTRESVDPSQPLTVAYTVGGTATPGADYAALSGSVTLPAGVISATIPVTPVDDPSYEGNETVSVTLQAGANFVVSTSQGTATVTIADDEQQVTLTATDNTAAESVNDTGTLMVLRLGPTTAALTVNYTVGGTATAISDYTALSGTLTIPAGQSSASITVTALSDTLLEVTETVVVTLATSPNYSIGSPASATVNILDTPTVSLAAGVNAAEPATPGSFIISRADVYVAALTVNYTVGGTAEARSDYTALSGSATIPGNASSVTVSVVPLDDALFEEDETVTLTLSASPNYYQGTSTAIITLLDNEQLVAIAATDATAAETGGDTGAFTVSRRGPTTAPLTVNYAVSGSATPGSDYTALGGSVTIPAAQSSATLLIAPVPDTLTEGTETVVVTLSADIAYLVGTPASATVNLLDAPAVAVTAGADAAEPSTPGSFLISRVAAPSPLNVFYTMGGSATSGTDYNALSGTATIPANAISVTVSVTPIDDTTFEGDEDITLTLTPNTAYSISTATATILLRENDQRVTIVATDPTAAEVGPDTGTFTVTREGLTTAALSVNFTVTGTANSGNDYVALGTTLTIPAGQSSATLTVTPKSDNNTENTETVIVTLSANAAYTVGTPNSATVSILDTPVATVTAGANAAEPATPGSFTLSRSATAATPLTVFYSASGTASAGTDYATLSGSAVIPANARTVLVNVLPIDDQVLEGAETVILTIQPGAGYKASTATATLTLADNELPPAPTGLVASTIPGRKLVDLAWNTVFTATSYKIKRAASRDGPFNVIATVSNTSYRNSGLVLGTTYFYKVSAVNASGEGPDSAVVFATPLAGN